MDDRMQELLDRTKAAAATMGNAARVTARYAGQRTGEWIEVTRRKGKIFELESEIKTLLREMGQTVYGTLQTGQSQEVRLDELTQRLDQNYAAVAGLKEEIAILRDAKECPACGTVCARSDRYCKECGAAL